MKAHKPNTDQDAEVIFCVNGKPVTEYSLPDNGANARDDIVECVVPVEVGDRITIRGNFNGSVLNGSIDLLLDGSFLADTHIEGSDLRLFSNRKIIFKKALTCPIPPGWTSIESPKDMEQGPIYVQHLDQAKYGDYTRFELASHEGMIPGLGSLQVIIYVNQRAGDYYYDKYQDITVGHWRTRDSQLVRKSGILPEYELMLKVEPEPVTQKRSARHRRHWTGTHFGSMPWAKFVFYYRSKAAIRRAGCIERPSTVQNLEPANKAAFIHAGAKANETQQSDEIDEEEDVAAAVIASPSNDTDYTLPAVASPSNDTDYTLPAVASPSNDMDQTPKKEHRQKARKKENKRLGGQLSLPPSMPRSPHVGTSQSVGRSPGDNTNPQEKSLSEIFTAYGAAEKNASLKSSPDVFTSPNQPLSRPASAVKASSKRSMGFTHSKTENALSHASETRHGPTSPAAATSLPPPPLKQFEDSVQPDVKHDDDNGNLAIASTDVTADMVHSDASLAATLRRVPTASAIRDRIPPDGLEDFDFHMMYVDLGAFRHHENEAKAAFDSRKNEVAVRDPVSDRWFRKDGSASASNQGEDSPRRDSALRDIENKPAEAPPEGPDLNSWLNGVSRGQLFSPQPEPAAEPDAVKIKDEEVDIGATPDTPTPIPAAPSTPHQTKQPESAKRTASERGRTSPPGTDSPAAKRAKKQSSARKNELQQQVAAKAAMKEEMTRKLKAKNEAKETKREAKRQEKRRLEAEEAEEIAKLERENAEYDAEIAAMEEQLKESDDEDDDEDEGEDADEDEESEAE
ncbi:hypothetical protein M409DRAFT_21058 [Zasmidium cellare ATCC 36951]|uniref:Uncharacterized protein n=1 Tax=Zasmidium cellare ATCC 36951 TaxID=1080233 RepID=A0A6A6CTE8_ZASCE|nr:uncharacterized protein M409DRAFT_21058 [Zasmidium cellare ATCC 36951]KAF2169049.1 hypothetical protein M409DRAFT_21058 [Zasmidium cellare ATCC 36951]